MTTIGSASQHSNLGVQRRDKSSPALHSKAVRFGEAGQDTVILSPQQMRAKLAELEATYIAAKHQYSQLSNHHARLHMAMYREQKQHGQSHAYNALKDQTKRLEEQIGEIQRTFWPTQSEIYRLKKELNPYESAARPVADPVLKAQARKIAKKGAGWIGPVTEEGWMQRYTALYGKTYDRIRSGYYPNKFPQFDDEAIQSFTWDNEDIEQMPLGYWIQRSFLDVSAFDRNLSRYAMNVGYHPDLLQAIHTFMERHGGVYKIVASQENWSKRPDTLIYSPVYPLMPQEERELAEVIQPYVRSDEGLDGTIVIGANGKAYPGIRLQKTATSAEENALIDQCYQVDEALGKAIQKELQGTFFSSGSSPGQIRAVKELLAQLMGNKC